MKIKNLKDYLRKVLKNTGFDWVEIDTLDTIEELLVRCRVCGKLDVFCLLDLPNSKLKCSRCSKAFCLPINFDIQSLTLEIDSYNLRTRRTSGELLVANILNYLRINYKEQISLKVNGKRRIPDFTVYTNEDKVLAFIEYNGRQHYEPVPLFGGLDQFEIQVARDKELKLYCQLNGINFIEIPYTMSFADIVAKLINQLQP